MNLYEMTKEFENELDAFDAVLNPDWVQNGNGEFITEDGELITPAEYRQMIENRFAVLDSMEQDVQKKALNVAAYIANMTADIESIKQRERILSTRRKSKENTVQSLKRYLMNCMEAASLKKIDSPELCISVRNNAESVEITDTEKFIEWAQHTDHEDLLKYSAPEIRKSAIKPYLKDGTEIPYAALTRTKSIIIK
jgi:hypothetical protein